MKILALDIGTGTQDIFLFNSNLDMENNFKLVIPSPTMIVHQQIKLATERGDPIFLSGVTMGGGPSAWATEAHLRSGFKVYATPDAARTINDDLEVVGRIGIEVISEDEAARLTDSVQRIHFQDFDLPAITLAFKTFGVNLDQLAAIAVGVFDHGNAPPNISDRQFRFDYLDERIRKLNKLSAFAFRAEDVPSIMTRLLAVVNSAKNIDVPLVVMDTAPAAVLGATLDRNTNNRDRLIIANVGNFHTLAFRLGPNGIEGLFEHHTGLVNLEKLETLLCRLADGTLRHEDVFSDQGHGALVYDKSPLKLNEKDYDVVVTGPRRSIFHPKKGVDQKQTLRPYFATPYGDMMITGCFGLLAATMDVIPEIADPIRSSLFCGEGNGTAPWDSD